MVLKLHNPRLGGNPIKKQKPKAQEIEHSLRSYQRRRAELQEESDMLGADMEAIRKAFFTPLKVIE